MKSKAPLAMMEQVLMVLVFALAATLCIQVFVFSGQTSRWNEARDRAVLVAQNAAETLKACGGETVDALEEASRQMGGSSSQGVWSISYDEDWNIVGEEDAVYQLEVRENPAQVEGLGQADIQVTAKQSAVSAGEPLFSMTVAWQEVFHG